MVLVDTSVWIDHLRSTDEQLVNLLEQGLVSIHPMIIGELSCGYLQNREQLLSLWKNLSGVNETTHNEAMYCLERNDLMGKGIGFIDLHLLASTLLTPNTSLWTGDRRLQRLAESLGICWQSTC
ncbi:MAG: type II toxin-antitoxin system VapC family toxin [Pseudomonadales bacterium]|nr:type II toxin-antitoxin system VapC family toxin [Pseudomonadales bacterium]